MRPTRYVVSPACVNAASTSSARAASTMSTMPRPMLNVLSASASSRCAASHTNDAMAGTGHVPRSTSAAQLFGSARSRFSEMPPPVMCASACTAPSQASSTARTGFT